MEKRVEFINELDGAVMKVILNSKYDIFCNQKITIRDNSENEVSNSYRKMKEMSIVIYGIKKDMVVTSENYSNLKGKMIELKSMVDNYTQKELEFFKVQGFIKGEI